jgi:hypothetical protein
MFFEVVEELGLNEGYGLYSPRRAEKTRSGGRRGFQPPHKANRIKAGFSPGGTFISSLLSLSG